MNSRQYIARIVTEKPRPTPPGPTGDFRYPLKSVCRKSKYLAHPNRSGLKMKLNISFVNRNNSDNPIARPLERNIVDIIKAISEMTNTWIVSVSSSSRELFMEEPPELSENPVLPENSSCEAAMPATAVIAAHSRRNKHKETNLDSRIFPRLHGRMRSSLMVPPANSPATISAAMMTVNIALK